MGFRENHLSADDSHEISCLMKYHALFVIFLKKAAKFGVLALRDNFVPLWNQKLEIAFHQVHPIGL